jgi:hypothetical protein
LAFSKYETQKFKELFENRKLKNPIQNLTQNLGSLKTRNSLKLPKRSNLKICQAENVEKS